MEWQLHILKQIAGLPRWQEAVMRLGFSRLLLSVMLLFPLSAGVLAQSNSASNEQTARKEKTQIVAVKKKQTEKQQNSGGTKKAKQ